MVLPKVANPRIGIWLFASLFFAGCGEPVEVTNFANQALSPNSAPTIGGNPFPVIKIGVAYSFTPIADDSDDDTLTFSIQNIPSWAAFDSSTGNLAGTPAFGNEGTYNDIVLTVSDGLQSTSLAPFSITVESATARNLSPTIDGLPETGVTIGQAYLFTPIAFDPDGDPLTFSILNLPTWGIFDISTGQISGTPRSGEEGTYRNILISVTDTAVSVSLPAFSITVNAQNSAPTITGTPASAVTAGQPYLFTPTSSDPDGDTLTFSIQNQPVWAAFDTGNGRLSGTPQAGDDDVYPNIMIAVTDGTDSVSLPAFSITVNAQNSAPTITGTPASAVTAGQPYLFTPTSSDPDGDTLTFSIQNQPAWATFDTGNGRLSGTPQAGDDDVYSNIMIAVTDGTDSVSLPAFSITVNAQNSAPTITGTPASAVTAGQPYLFTPTSSDPDGDTLTFSIQNQPVWAAFDTGNGRLSGTPQAGDDDVYPNIMIAVTDGTDSVSLPAFSITVNAQNSAPTITGTPASAVTAGQPYLFTPTSSDPDGDTLTFSIQNQPVWAAFDTGNGRLSGTPQAGDDDVYPNIMIAVTDGTDSVSLPAFSITVNAQNSAPTITGTPASAVTAGQPYLFTPTSSDPDGDTLTFSIQNQPVWAAFDTGNGRLSGTPQAGDDDVYPNIMIAVTDGTDSVSLPAFSITVNAQNSAPTITGTPASAVTAGQPYLFTPTSSDPDGDTLTFSIQNQPVWAAFDTGNGRLSGTPQAGDDDVYPNIMIAVTDGTDSVSLPAFSITVNAQNSMPTVTINANPTTVTSGNGTTLSWTSTDATSCSASGAWSGPKATSGNNFSSSPLTEATNVFILDCSGPGGNASDSATVTVTDTGAISGLDFQGSASTTGTVRFRFTNPLPIYPATYIWRIYPRRQSGYYTTFFWGNDGSFTWPDTDTYYGFHPYPQPPPSGTDHRWEVSADGGDFLGGNVVYEQWHTQAAIVWNDGSNKQHLFYWDLADTNRVINVTLPGGYGNKYPPNPALTWGDAPWNPSEEIMNGVLRGVQIYSSALSLAEIQAESASPLSTIAGQNSIWYLNTNPTPTDISDKSGTGNHPEWVGGERPLLWEGQ